MFKRCKVTKQISSIKMKLLVCCMFLVASTQAASFANERNAKILRSDNDIYPDGSYNHGYETENGIEVEESGVAGISVSGSARYVGSDGTPIELTYIADENGYQPQGAHLPVGPAIPDYILRALAYIESHPNKNDPYAYVHQADPVYETKVNSTPKPVKTTTYKPYVRPTYKSTFATTRSPQPYRRPVSNKKGRYNL